MRGFRAGSSAFTSIVLLWQLSAVIVLPMAFCCRAVESATPSSNEMMANCPMHQQAATDASCPLHTAKSGTHECDCPTLGCSQTDKGFMAVFGPIGVLPAPAFLTGLELAGKTPSIAGVSTISLAAVPPAPPPRA